MDLVLSYECDIPIYMQLYEQVSGQIMQGNLGAHSPLPPIRTVAKELRISIIPVKRAWEELERNGFIYTIAGKGCFVSPHNKGELTSKRDAIVMERMAQDVSYYRSLGLTLTEIIALVEKAYTKQ